jgi:hypothetical protein
MTATKALRLLLALGAAGAWACGAPQPPPDPPAGDAPPDEEPEAIDDGMAVEGLRGSLRRDEVDPVLNAAARRFQQCFVDAFDEHPYLAGDLSLELVVSPNGSVRAVRTTSATLGSRAVEECILRIARGLGFPRPHGGEATVDYGPLVMSSDDGRAFDVWDVGRLEEAQWTAVQEAIRSCTRGASGFSTTLYVGPGGRVRSIGAVAPSAAVEDGARCLERELAALPFPDPGSGRVAKLTVEL